MANRVRVAAEMVLASLRSVRGRLVYPTWMILIEGVGLTRLGYGFAAPGPHDAPAEFSGFRARLFLLSSGLTLS